MRNVKFSILLISVALTYSAFADQPLAQFFNFDGTLTDPNSGAPITTTATVEFKIWNPSGPSGNCLLYDESQTVAPDSLGNFSVQIGSAVGSSKRVSPDPGIAWFKIFQNSVSPVSCYSNPTSGDVRVLQVIVNTTALTPTITLGAVPTATVSETLQGMPPSSFVQFGTAPNLTQTNINTMFSTAGWTNLQNVISGNYSQNSSAGTSVIPNLGSDPSPGVLTAGDIWFNGGLKYYDGTTIQTLGGSSSVNLSGSVTGLLSMSNGGTGATSPAAARANLAAAASGTNSDITSLTALSGPVSSMSALNLSAGSGANINLTTSGAGATIINNGNVGIGTTAPMVSLDASLRTDGLAVPIGNTAQEPVTPPYGTLRYNSDQYTVESYVWPGQWETLTHKYNGRYGFGTTAPNSLLEINAGGLTQNPSLTYGSTLAVDGVPFSDAQTGASGTIAGTAFVTLNGSSVGALNSNVTTTNAVTVLINGAPTAGTNQSLTNSSALMIQGNTLSTPVTNGYGLNVTAPTGSLHSYAAIFKGGNVGIGTVNPTQQLDVAGNVRAVHYVGGSPSPTVVVGSGAGTTGQSATFMGGFDTAGSIQVTVGTAGMVPSSPVVTLTFGQSYASPPFCVISPANAATAGMNSGMQVFVTSTPTTMVINANSTALGTGLVLQWNYICSN